MEFKNPAENSLLFTYKTDKPLKKPKVQLDAFKEHVNQALVDETSKAWKLVTEKWSLALETKERRDKAYKKLVASDPQDANLIVDVLFDEFTMYDHASKAMVHAMRAWALEIRILKLLEYELQAERQALNTKQSLDQLLVLMEQVYGPRITAEDLRLTQQKEVNSHHAKIQEFFNESIATLEQAKQSSLQKLSRLKLEAKMGTKTSTELEAEFIPIDQTMKHLTLLFQKFSGHHDETPSVEIQRASYQAEISWDATDFVKYANSFSHKKFDRAISGGNLKACDAAVSALSQFSIEKTSDDVEHQYSDFLEEGRCDLACAIFYNAELHPYLQNTTLSPQHQGCIINPSADLEGMNEAHPCCLVLVNSGALGAVYED